MNDHTHLEKLQQTALTHDQQQRLLGMIDTIFKCAIDTRSPQNRPPGKAGLKAEKGYYRLLYLEQDFHQKINPHLKADPHVPTVSWEHLSNILRQLTDIPDLRSEILAEVESALDKILHLPRP